MRKTEVANLLSVMAAFDFRTVSETDVLAWHNILEDVSFDDAARETGEAHE